MKPQQEASDQEVLAGLVERVAYHNVENGFCVLRAKVRGHRDVVTVVGHAAAIAAGEWITVSGGWVNDHTHGQQFKARFLRTSSPTTADGIEKYLSSGMIRGVGPVYARKLVRAFGDKVFDIIEASPDRLREVGGIGPVRAASILSAWAEQKAGGVGARSLNIELQAALNPAGDRKVERFGWTFAPGDKVMQIENDYDKEVYNGDIGYIDDVNPDDGELTASFDDRTVTYGFGELDMLVPAYAATIHKSQGSEYPAVVIPVGAIVALTYVAAIDDPARFKSSKRMNSSSSVCHR